MVLIYNVTWYGLVECLANKIVVFAKKGGLSNVSQHESRVCHRAHTYLYRPNSEMSNISK